MRKLFYIFLICSTAAFSQGTALFEEANTAYAEENYALAVEKYTQILEGGETAAAVHFNLANAHYKLNEVAPSIYHYEKALQLAPNDEDIKNNLAFAQNMRIDAIEEASQTGFAKWWQSLLNIFSTTGWAWAAIVFMLLFVGFFIAYYFLSSSSWKRFFFITGSVFLLLALASTGLGFAKLDQQANQNFAIVFEEQVEVKSEPNEGGDELFFLHEGAKVELLEDFQEWTKIELGNGNQGWIEKRAVKQL